MFPANSRWNFWIVFPWSIIYFLLLLEYPPVGGIGNKLGSDLVEVVCCIVFFGNLLLLEGLESFFSSPLYAQLGCCLAFLFDGKLFPSCLLAQGFDDCKPLPFIPSLLF